MEQQPIETKDVGGRPTKYNDDMVFKAIEYVAKTKIPFIEGLALELDVHRETIREWGDKYPRFSATLDKLKHKQFMAMAIGGLDGTLNPTITKLLLSFNHGVIDTERRELTGKDGEKLSGVVVEIVDKQNDTQDPSDQRPEADSGSSETV